MAFPTDYGAFILDTNASDETIGAVLTLIQTGIERVVAYGSQTWGSLSRTIVQLIELLTVKYIMEYYKHYLLG